MPHDAAQFSLIQPGFRSHSPVAAHLAQCSDVCPPPPSPQSPHEAAQCSLIQLGLRSHSPAAAHSPQCSDPSPPPPSSAALGSSSRHTPHARAQLRLMKPELVSHSPLSAHDSHSGRLSAHAPCPACPLCASAATRLRRVSLSESSSSCFAAAGAAAAASLRSASSCWPESPFSSASDRTPLCCSTPCSAPRPASYAHAHASQPPQARMHPSSMKPRLRLHCPLRAHESQLPFESTHFGLTTTRCGGEPGRSASTSSSVKCASAAPLPKMWPAVAFGQQNHSWERKELCRHDSPGSTSPILLADRPLIHQQRSGLWSSFTISNSTASLWYAQLTKPSSLSNRSTSSSAALG
mmetsp:Transcript_3395/g.11365  ORF Transcript_3395/g.11365 Transcript_3395/m.11365 type:complete len:351 (+) Transcript_3395:155-1207(+)